MNETDVWKTYKEAIERMLEKVVGDPVDVKDDGTPSDKWLFDFCGRLGAASGGGQVTHRRQPGVVEVRSFAPDVEGVPRRGFVFELRDLRVNQKIACEAFAQSADGSFSR